MTLHTHTPLAGRFKMEAVSVNADGTERRRPLTDGWVDNRITNGGLDSIGLAGNRVEIVRSCQVGAGSTAPADTDVALDSFVALTTSLNGAVLEGHDTTGSPSFGWRRWTFRFGQGAAAGNLTEIGIGYLTTAGSLFSRALIKDGSGAPTTITVLSTEFLDVTYEVRCYQPSADVSSVETIEGVNYDVVRRQRRINYKQYWFAHLPEAFYFQDQGGDSLGHEVAEAGLVSETGDQSSSTSGTGGAWAYTSGNYYADKTTTFGISQANYATGIGSVLHNTGMGAYQYGFTPKIPKDNTKSLTITTRHSWGRYAP